jgi:hypothetical protein
MSNQAVLIVMGDPSIKPMRNVLVVVLTNKQRANGTYITVPHYTSGIWGIMSVRHVIQNGEFITQLSLFRNDAINEDGQLNTNVIDTDVNMGVARSNTPSSDTPADQTQNNFLNTYQNANIRR